MLGQVHDPDLHLLRLFVTVVEAGGFSAAQGVLGLSQPTISQRMAQLEARLGYRLCSRGKGGFRLTEKGELLLDAARGLLLNIEQFRQQANGVAGRLLGPVRIGMAENQDKAVSLKLAAAIALTVAGGVLTSLVSAQGSGSEGSLAGVLAMLGAVITYVWYSRELVLRFGDSPDLAKTSASMLIAGFTCLAIALAVAAFTGDVPRHEFSGATVAKLVLLACVSVGLSAVLWLWTGRMVGVTVAAMHHNLVPFYVILLASAGGAVVTGQHLLGAVLVIAGAVIAQLRPRRRKAGVTQPVPAGRKPQA